MPYLSSRSISLNARGRYAQWRVARSVTRSLRSACLPGLTFPYAAPAGSGQKFFAGQYRHSVYSGMRDQVLTLFSSFHLEVDSGRNVGGLLAACATLISTHAGSR